MSPWLTFTPAKFWCVMSSHGLLPCNNGLVIVGLPCGARRPRQTISAGQFCKLLGPAAGPTGSWARLVTAARSLGHTWLETDSPCSMGQEEKHTQSPLFPFWHGLVPGSLMQGHSGGQFCSAVYSCVGSLWTASIGGRFRSQLPRSCRGVSLLSLCGMSHACSQYTGPWSPCQRLKVWAVCGVGWGRGGANSTLLD